MAETQRLGRHRQVPPERLGIPARRRYRGRLAVAIVATAIAIVVIVAFVVRLTERPGQAAPAAQQSGSIPLPSSTGSYVGVYPNGVPYSYNGVTAFSTATGVRPSLVLYYSGWMEPFQMRFAMTVSNNGAIPVVQLDPKNVSIAAIASGNYDSYLSRYAKAVRDYRRPVILSFGHEMNGYWYSWGYLHTPAAVFVAAWRHIVTLFRSLEARNVTWMWTINTIHKRGEVPSPGPWWPGSAYVNWVGIDGYYFDSSLTFAPLFGPTITAVRALTHDPILISETAAATSADQPAKIADLFAGVHLYGLLGFVWFNAVHTQDWRLSGAASFAAFRRSFETYHQSATSPSP